MAVTAVFLDVGETIADESDYWGSIADRLGIPRLTFFAVAGALIDRGVRDHREFFAAFDAEPVEGERRFTLYADALPCLRRLRQEGYLVGLAANQPEWAATALAEAGVDVDVVATSAAWGVAKPSAEFFARVVDAAGRPAHEIAYVGDRVDNDVEPALAAGMVAVHIRRGPWGRLQPGRERAHARIDTLDELPGALAGV
jgi:HAD superfamily hydrolase (TIGR01549 family)